MVMYLSSWFLVGCMFGEMKIKEEVHHLEQALNVYSLSPYLVHFLCFTLMVEVVSSQFHVVHACYLLYASPL